MKRTLAVVALFAASVLMAPTTVAAGPDDGCELNCRWDAHFGPNGEFLYWSYECPLYMLCDAPAEPPPP